MSESEKLINQAKVTLTALLNRIEFLSVGGEGINHPIGIRNLEYPDFVLPVQSGDQRWDLLCEVKSQAQPRQVRITVSMLKDILATGQEGKYPVLIAPYISADSAEICQQSGVGYVDFAGNCYLNFGTVFIERSGVPNPNAEKRGLRSIFGPKSERILRQIIREPARYWRVADLAVATGTSLGQVSNVRRALIEHEWATVGPDGLKLIHPDALLNAWRDIHARRRTKRYRYYTLLHGGELDMAIKTAMDNVKSGKHILLASYSAAHWLAPFVRYPTNVFLADDLGEARLRECLRLESASKGENVVVERATDDGIFADGIEAAPGVWTTGLVQTYLDLWISGERGREAAEHLLKTRIAPSWITMT